MGKQIPGPPAPSFSGLRTSSLPSRAPHDEMYSVRYGAPCGCTRCRTLDQSGPEVCSPLQDFASVRGLRSEMDCVRRSSPLHINTAHARPLISASATSTLISCYQQHFFNLTSRHPRCASPTLLSQPRCPFSRSGPQLPMLPPQLALQQVHSSLLCIPQSARL